MVDTGKTYVAQQRFVRKRRDGVRSLNLFTSFAACLQMVCGILVFTLKKTQPCWLP